MPKSPGADRPQNDNEGPARRSPSGESEPMNMRRREGAQPRRDVQTFCPCWPFFDVATPEADRDETLRMIVEISRPIVADKLMQIDAPILKLQECPSVEIDWAKSIAVDFFEPEIPVQPIAKFVHKRSNHSHTRPGSRM